MVEEVFIDISDKIGVSTVVLYYIIFFSIATLTTALILLNTGSLVLGLLVSIFPIATGTTLGYLSLVTLVIYTLFITIYVCFYIGTGRGRIGQDPVEDFNWEAYGEKLKNAYSANFFGENRGFNQEVDARIQIMVNTDYGVRRQWAKGWLKKKSQWMGVDWMSLGDSNYKE